MSDSFPAPEGAFSTEPPKAKDAPIPVVKLAERQRTPPAWRHYLITVLLVGVTAAVVALIISVGVNLLFRDSGGGGGGRLLQEGKVGVGLDSEREVFYAIPYAGPPNLVLEGNVDANAMNAIKIKEQKPDHFTVQNMPGPFGRRIELHWRADGIRADK